jgi:hypothetical protein
MGTAEPKPADRAALAFSAIRPREAMKLSEKLSITDRQRLREGMQRVRSAPQEARIAALHRLIAAVQAGTVFPAPMAHEEDSCPFRRMERSDHDMLGGVLERQIVTDPLLVAVAFCHFSTETRDELWAMLPARSRSTVHRALGHVPSVTHSRTRRFAADLDAAMRRAARRPVA